MRTVRSFANEEAELKHFDLKLRDTIKIVIRKATIYGAWMSSNTVSIALFHANPSPDFSVLHTLKISGSLGIRICNPESLLTIFIA
jgi:hypothetical protein